MIDIHTHVLPGIDDGSRSMDETLEMLLQAEESGVKVLVTTPHCNIPDEFDNYVSEDLDRLWRRVESEARRVGNDLKICHGMEIFATEELPDLLESGGVWTLNGTKYFLTEFDFGEDPDFCRYILQRCRSRGFRPIIAHPERYYFLQRDPQIAYEWCTAGYGLQLNKGSLSGAFGRGAQKTAHLMLSNDLADVIASDAHGTERRTTDLSRVQDFISMHYSHRMAERLLEDNPARILRDESLVPGKREMM